ncbi:MAG: amidase family protein [Candidatus Puniceispirillales bacterium]
MHIKNKSINNLNNFFKQLKKYQDYKIFVHIDKNDAVKAAIDSDKRLKPLSEIDGTLIAVKSNIQVKGFPFTGGIEEYKYINSDYNDPLIDLIKTNGGIIIGLTNMDEAAFGGDTSTSFYGTCENPLNTNCSVGGSSGGSAAAISSGLVNYAIGTDTMGSVRIPASYCGITSFKPSSILNNNNFIKKLSNTYDTIGYMGKEMININNLVQCINQKIKVKKIDTNFLKNKNYVVPNQIFDSDINDDVLQNFKSIISKLIKNNINIKYKDLNYWEPNNHRKALLKIVEYEGSKNLKKLLDNNKSKISESLRKNLIYGKNLNDNEIKNIKNDLENLKQNINIFFENNDLIIMPTTPQTTFNRMLEIPYNQANFTSLANIADLPAITLPIYQKENKKPFSLQIMSSNKNDHNLLKISSYLEKILQ